MVVVSGVSLIRVIRKGALATELRDDAAPAPTQPDWLSLGEIEVRVDGTREHYLVIPTLAIRDAARFRSS